MEREQARIERRRALEQEQAEYKWEIAGGLARGVALCAAELGVFLPASVLSERAALIRTFVPSSLANWARATSDKLTEKVAVQLTAKAGKKPVPFSIKNLRVIHAFEGLKSFALMAIRDAVTGIATEGIHRAVYAGLCRLPQPGSGQTPRTLSGRPVISGGLASVYKSIAVAVAITATFPMKVWSIRAHHHLPASSFYDVSTFSSGALPVAIMLQVFPIITYPILVDFFAQLYYAPLFMVQEHEKQSRGQPVPEWRDAIYKAIYRGCVAFSAATCVALVTLPLHTLLIRMLVWNDGSAGAYDALASCASSAYQSGALYEGLGWYLLKSAGRKSLMAVISPESLTIDQSAITHF